MTKPQPVIDSFYAFEQFTFRPPIPDWPLESPNMKPCLGFRFTFPDSDSAHSYYIELDHGDDGSWITHRDLFDFRSACLEGLGEIKLNDKKYEIMFLKTKWPNNK